MTDDEQSRGAHTIQGWAALKTACRKQHPGGAGGAAMCACGAPGGGSAACSMLRELRQLLAAIDPATQRGAVRAYLEILQGAVH